MFPAPQGHRGQNQIILFLGHVKKPVVITAQHRPLRIILGQLMLQYIGYAVGHVGNQNHIHFLLVGQQLALYVQHQITNLIKAYLRQPELFRQYPAYNLAYIDGTLIIIQQYIYDRIPGRGTGRCPVQHQRDMGYHIHIKC